MEKPITPRKINRRSEHVSYTVKAVVVRFRYESKGASRCSSDLQPIVRSDQVSR